LPHAVRWPDQEFGLEHAGDLTNLIPFEAARQIGNGGLEDQRLESLQPEAPDPSPDELEPCAMRAALKEQRLVRGPGVSAVD
jgi:hypothetical protein